ncbi:metallophosphoesterase family protein [Almyronema epifaneia]|uniref:Metallophosphoesterase family protein n=1 Tax=Almyronema epifaneia S1 TaxID=2991925 RepID=A0ABW6IJN0_9CYAN
MSSAPYRIQLPDDCQQIALCGGPYSNFAAVEAFLAATANVPNRFCLGDMGGFGPDPNRTLNLLRAAEITCIQGNYDHAVGWGERDCGCGYSDPRDRQFAQISYDYTYTHTAPNHRQWLQQLPGQILLSWRDRQILLCHGSPDQVNEFVWETTTADSQIQAYCDRYQVDGICATHSGLPWIRTINHGADTRFWFNVGVLGRPAHEGLPHVYYGLLSWEAKTAQLMPRLVPLTYDVAAVTQAMQQAGLPPEFVQSLEQGIWTTCAEVLPAAEKAVKPRVHR